MAKEATEVEPGSPEDRILQATIESMEACGKIITPEKRESITCSFMMGYTAGFSVSGAKGLEIFLGEEKVKEQGMLTVEEMIQSLISSANKVTLNYLTGEQDERCS